MDGNSLEDSVFLWRFEVELSRLGREGVKSYMILFLLIPSFFLSFFLSFCEWVRNPFQPTGPAAIRWGFVNYWNTPVESSHWAQGGVIWEGISDHHWSYYCPPTRFLSNTTVGWNDFDSDELTRWLGERVAILAGHKCGRFLCFLILLRLLWCCMIQWFIGLFS